MSKTDRQTDKGTCWSITAFNDEIEQLLNKVNVPEFVKEIHGGVEVCPETGKKHYQGCVVLYTQQRMSALKKWLPTAHFEIARNREALKKYALKEETAAGDKTSWANPQQYEQLHEWLLKAAKEFILSEDEYYSCLKKSNRIVSELKDPARDTYIWATSRLISQDLSKINKYSNPQFISAWRMYEPVLLRAARLLVRQDEEAAGGYSITPPATAENLFSEVTVQNAQEEWSLEESPGEAQL